MSPIESLDALRRAVLGLQSENRRLRRERDEARVDATLWRSAYKDAREHLPDPACWPLVTKHPWEDS